MNAYWATGQKEDLPLFVTVVSEWLKQLGIFWDASPVLPETK